MRCIGAIVNVEGGLFGIAILIPKVAHWYYVY